MRPPFRLASLLLAIGLAACGPGEQAAVPIGAVQGSDEGSPLTGGMVTVEGVVVGDFVAGLGGFFLQSAEGEDDGDPDTSDGLFVEWPAGARPAVRAGQRLRVSGQVAELGPEGGSLTSLIRARVEVLGHGRAAPVRLAAPPDSPAGWERYEGMLLHIEAPLVLSGHYRLAREGEVVTSFDGRLWQPTELARPGPAARALAGENARRRLLLDDGHSGPPGDGHPWYLPAPSTEAPLRSGSVLHGVEGVLDQREGRYRLQLVAPIARIEQAARPPVPDVPGALRVAAFNLENLFNGDGAGGGFPTPRGAATHADYLRQQAKLVAAVQALAPDVAALSEVENDGDGPDSALAGFVDALNAAGPARDWRFVPTGPFAGGDAIRVALIYRADRVERVGEVAGLTAAPFDWGSRPPLAAAFRRGETPPVVVVANHFKSKGSCPQAGDPNADQRDGQACWSPLREASALALGDWIDSDPTQTGSDYALIIGDLNSNSQEDPIHALRQRGWVDAFGDGPSYSYVFDAQAGRLDHALLSPALAARLRGAAKWHINADESPDWFGYAGCLPDRCDGPWASSDHDPLLLGLDP